ncbi:MAG: NAD(P)/FAD-dependent oxidoreductase [Gammaproteobacteria bacterium]|nr:NAD(P)/FAD-dependent oxidoreductase [Gammaproteobacteria bacterium]
MFGIGNGILRGLGLTARVFEAGSGIGGTWFWNRYPGARCDIESLEYSYQFSDALQKEWEWSERYATQPEILRYINHVADRFDLRDDMQFNTRVESAHYHEADALWRVTTSAGVVTARFCIMATGCLSCANRPDVPGLDRFQGAWYHTGAWPHEGVDFTGKRVAVIGTGSSAIQSIPIIAQEAAHLTVFQRTPNYSIPAHNGPLDPQRVAEVKANYPAFRAENWTHGFGANFRDSTALAKEATPEELEAEYEARWAAGGLAFLGAYADLVFDPEVNQTAAEFVRNKIRSIVDDPQIAEALCPTTMVGCKRMCVDSGYYETYNRDNVSLVDISRAAVERIDETGLFVAGKHYEVDAIVFATGFDAMTGALSRIDIRGRKGSKLNDKWAAGPRTYLGLSVAGFPNLFTVTGPGSPSVLSNMLPSIEQHVNWIADCIAYLDARQIGAIEATESAEEAWGEHVNEVANTSIYPSCNSWYLGANVPGKPRVFMPYLGVPTYVEKCRQVAANDYEGFEKTSA